MKKLIVLLLLVIAAAGGFAGYLYSQKQVIISDKITKGLEAAAGTPVALQGLSVEKATGFGHFQVSIQKIAMKNPGPELPENFILASNAELEIDFVSLLKGQWKISKASAQLSKVYFVMNKNGALNFSELPAIKNLMTPPASTAKEVRFEISRLELTYDRLYFWDLREEPVKKQTFPLKGKFEVYTRVSDPALLVQIPVMTGLTHVNQGSLGLPRGKLQESIRQHLEAA